MTALARLRIAWRQQALAVLDDQNSPLTARRTAWLFLKQHRSS